MNKSILLAPALALALAGCAGAGHDKPKSYVVHTAPVETVPAPVQPSPQLEAISSGNACPSDIGVPYTFDAEESSALMRISGPCASTTSLTPPAMPWS